VVSLRADRCACGFDLETKEVGAAIAVARRDRWRACAMLLGGIPAAVAVVAIIAMSPLAAGLGSMRLFVLLMMAAIFLIGRGTWLLFDSARRLAVAEQMRQPPVARVVPPRGR
jgi:hypothetical protein